MRIRVEVDILKPLQRFVILEGIQEKVRYGEGSNMRDCLFSVMNVELLDMENLNAIRRKMVMMMLLKNRNNMGNG